MEDVISTIKQEISNTIAGITKYNKKYFDDPVLESKEQHLITICKGASWAKAILSRTNFDLNYIIEIFGINSLYYHEESQKLVNTILTFINKALDEHLRSEPSFLVPSLNSWMLRMALDAKDITETISELEQMILPQNFRLMIADSKTKLDLVLVKINAYDSDI